MCDVYKCLCRVAGVNGLEKVVRLQKNCKKCLKILQKKRPGNPIIYLLLPSVKTLGILWHAEDDTFRFSICGRSPVMKITKRSYLKKMSTLFDPIGFIEPYTEQK